MTAAVAAVSFRIECTGCGRHVEPHGRYVYGCPACGSILTAKYDLDALRGAWLPQRLALRPRGLARWRELLPLSEHEPFVSLGEGDTPLVEVVPSILGCGAARLYLKLESCNPTGSFKDRAIAVGISKARCAGAAAVIISSTGNAGLSAAAYSARARLPCVVLVPQQTPAAAIQPMARCGARVLRVEGDISALFDLAVQAANRLDWVNLATTYLSPYPTEGDKTVGFEVAQQLGWRSPDWVIIPVGDGPLLYACHQAFSELYALGLVDRKPRFAAVQAAGCAPIHRAWVENQEQVEPWEEPQTVAKGIADPLKGYHQDGTLTLQTIRASDGVAVAVSDEEILSARDALSRRAGVITEATGAVPLAGMWRLQADGHLNDTQTVVLLITGHGIKDPVSTSAEWPLIANDLSALRKALGHG